MGLCYKKIRIVKIFICKTLNTINIMKKNEYFLPITGSILFFLLSKEVVPTILYAFIAVLLSLYFFPVRLLYLKYEETIRDKWLFAITSLLFSKILAVSVAMAYVDNSVFYRNFFIVLTILNFCFAVYLYLKNNKLPVLSFLFIFFTGIVLYT